MVAKGKGQVANFFLLLYLMIESDLRSEKEMKEIVCPAYVNFPFSLLSTALCM